MIIQIGDFIGSGASGSVHLATYKPTGMIFAIKSIKLYDKNTRNQFKNDLKVLSANKCKNIISFLLVYKQLNEHFLKLQNL